MKKKSILATAVMILSVLCTNPVYAMDVNTMEKYCDQVITVLNEEDRDMEVCATHIPLSENEDPNEINEYFHYNYYCGDTNVVLGTTICGKHGSKKCMIVQSIGSSKEAAAEHLEAVEEIQIIADSIPDDLSDKEKADLAFSWVTEHVTYAYETTEEAKAAISQTRGGYLCYDRIDITVYAALNRGKSICMGQSLLFNKICKIKDVPCSMGTNSLHAFNIVKIGNEQLLYDTVNGVSCGEAFAEVADQYPAYYKLDRLV